MGEGCTIGPLTHRDRRRRRRRGQRRALLPARRRGRARGDRRPVRLPAPGHRPAREGRRRARSSRSRTPTSARARRCPHLSYIGDADVGPGTNLGAATITANYDGRRQAPHDDRRERAHVGRHDARRAGHGRRRGLHGGELGDHRRRAARARWASPARARRTSRATRTARRPTGRPDRGVHSPFLMSVQVRPAMATSLPIDYDKRLMLFSGRANPELAGRIAEQARRRSRARHAEDVLQRRGLLPLRGVDPRRRRLHHPADVRQPATAASPRTTR